MSAELRFRFHPIGTLVALLIGGFFLLLTIWQVRRSMQKAAVEDVRDVRLDEPVLEVDSHTEVEASEREYRILRLRGELLTDRVALIRGRRFEGRVGCWVLSPFRLDGGGYLLANRGWVPMQSNRRCNRSGIGTSTGADGESRTGILIRESDVAGDTLEPVVSGDEWAEWAKLAPQRLWETWGLQPHSTGDFIVVLRGPSNNRAQSAPAGDRRTPTPIDGAVTHPYLNSFQHLTYALTWFAGFLLVLAAYLAASFGVHRLVAARMRESQGGNR